MEYSGIFTTDPFIYKLRRELANGLPGAVAQNKMSPSRRHSGEGTFEPGRAVPSGVLLVVFPGVEGWTTVFIERTAFGPHAGQISLPGGKKEVFDKTIVDTALRETSEEIGLDRSKITVLGQLSPLYVPHSNFNIFPVIGLMDETPVFTKDDNEVESVITVSIEELFNKNNKGEKLMQGSSYSITAPYYMAGGHIVWGATAMILSELEHILY